MLIWLVGIPVMACGDPPSFNLLYIIVLLPVVALSYLMGCVAPLSQRHLEFTPGGCVAFMAPLHLPKLLIISVPRLREKKISIIT